MEWTKTGIAISQIARRRPVTGKLSHSPMCRFGDGRVSGCEISESSARAQQPPPGQIGEIPVIERQQRIAMLDGLGGDPQIVVARTRRPTGAANGGGEHTERDGRMPAHVRGCVKTSTP